MGLHRALPPVSQQARTTEVPRHPRSSRHHLLRTEERLPLAPTTEGFPAVGTAYWWVGGWRADGTFERLNAALRERLRARLGRKSEPGADIADSRTTKSTGVGGEQSGYGGNKKMRGRKRHQLVDTEGLVLKAKVLSAKTPTSPGSRSDLLQDG